MQGRVGKDREPRHERDRTVADREDRDVGDAGVAQDRERYDEVGRLGAGGVREQHDARSRLGADGRGRAERRQGGREEHERREPEPHHGHRVGRRGVESTDKRPAHSASGYFCK